MIPTIDRPPSTHQRPSGRGPSLFSLLFQEMLNVSSRLPASADESLPLSFPCAATRWSPNLTIGLTPQRPATLCFSRQTPTMVASSTGS